MELNWKKYFPDRQWYIERHTLTHFRKDFSRFLSQEKLNIDVKMRSGRSTELTKQVSINRNIKSNRIKSSEAKRDSSFYMALTLFRNIFSWNHVVVLQSTLLFQLLVTILVSVTLTEGNPVKGMRNICKTI